MSGKKFGRRGDLWLCLAAVALILLGVFWAWPRQQDTAYGEITLEGQLYRRIQLTGHRGREVIPVRTERGENIIVVEDEEIFVQEADKAESAFPHAFKFFLCPFQFPGHQAAQEFRMEFPFRMRAVKKGQGTAGLRNPLQCQPGMIAENLVQGAQRQGFVRNIHAARYGSKTKNNAIVKKIALFQVLIVESEDKSSDTTD